LSLEQHWDPHIYGTELQRALKMKIPKEKFIKNENLQGYWDILNTFKVTGMQTLEKEYLWHSDRYVYATVLAEKMHNKFLVSTLFVLQIFLFKRQKYQLYAKWPTFGFWSLKICTIYQFTHGAALRFPYLWKLTILGLKNEDTSRKVY